MNNMAYGQQQRHHNNRGGSNGRSFNGYNGGRRPFQNNHHNQSGGNRPQRVQGPVSIRETGEGIVRPDLTRCNLNTEHAANLLETIDKNLGQMVSELGLEGTYYGRIFIENDGVPWLETNFTPFPYPEDDDKNEKVVMTGDLYVDTLESENQTQTPTDNSGSGQEGGEVGDAEDDHKELETPLVEPVSEPNKTQPIQYYIRMGGRSHDADDRYRNMVLVFAREDRKKTRDFTTLPPSGILIQSDPAALARLVTM